MLIGQDLDYYSKVFNQTQEELTTGESTLLNILYDGRINDKKSFNDILLRVYGFPFNNYEINKPYQEVACLASWKLFMGYICRYDATLLSHAEVGEYVVEGFLRGYRTSGYVSEIGKDEAEIFCYEVARERGGETFDDSD